MSRRIVPVLLAVALITGFAPAVASAQGEGIYRGTLPVAKFDVSPPLRDLARLGNVPASGKNLIADPPSGYEGELGPQDVDALVQDWLGPILEIPAPTVSFSGPGNISGVQPPDTVGDVGPNHYVIMTNLSSQVFDKTGVSLLGPFANNTLWIGFGGDCETD
ncbi:MAG TPA: hypothetical protein VLA66_12050, partial [Thermoanaerobaculia bacterium]|nr:hypothetical protein [Thermoanaerobaculia bacterium]